MLRTNRPLSIHKTTTLFGPQKHVYDTLKDGCRVLSEWLALFDSVGLVVRRQVRENFPDDVIPVYTWALQPRPDVVVASTPAGPPQVDCASSGEVIPHVKEIPP